MRFKADETDLFPKLMRQFKLTGQMLTCGPHLESLIKAREEEFELLLPIDESKEPRLGFILLDDKGTAPFLALT